MVFKSEILVESFAVLESLLKFGQGKVTILRGLGMGELSDDHGIRFVEFTCTFCKCRVADTSQTEFFDDRVFIGHVEVL